MPSVQNLEKICGYFGIDESELFRNGRAISDSNGAADSAKHQILSTVAEMLSVEVHATLSPGRYFATFRSPGDSQTIVRSTLIIRNEGNITTFRRLTGFAEMPGSWWSQFHGDHRGIVVERRHTIFLIAFNDLGYHEPSLMTLRWVPSSLQILAGHASIMTEAGPAIAPVVVTPCGPRVSLRTAIKRSRVYSIDDPAIDATVIDALEKQVNDLFNMIHKLDLSVTPVASERRSKRPISHKR